MSGIAVAALLLLAPALAAAQVSVPGPTGVRGEIPLFPPGHTQTFNIIEWDSNELPRIYERSEQLPLTDEEIAKLSRAGFTPAQIVKMIEERRCTCDASADGLIRLKEQGVAPEVLSAVSLHALKPNRSLQLMVTVDFAGTAHPPQSVAKGTGVPRDSFLYFFVDDGELTRVFTADVGEFLLRRFAHESALDRSDLLLVREIRRVQLPGVIPLKTYGRHTLLVTSAARPQITHPSELSKAERARAQSYSFDYPRSSLQAVCRLNVAFERDRLLAHVWTYRGSRFECEWN